MESEYDKANVVVSFTSCICSSSKLNNDDDASDDDMFNDELVETCQILYLKQNDECKVSKKKKDKVEVLLQDKACLMTTISELKEDVDHMSSKL